MRREFCRVKNIKNLSQAAFGVAEKRSRLRRFGEDCLSEANSVAAGVCEHRKEPERPCTGEMVLGPFAKTKGPRRAGAKPPLT